MLTGIDHIIIGVHDLWQAEQTFQKLGLAVSGGGVHPSGGTANRVIVIGDTYIELITVRTPAEAQQGMLERLAKGQGYLNFVLAADEIEADSEEMRKRGVAVIGPKRGELRAADGHSRAWQRTDIERPDLAQRYPFIIQGQSFELAEPLPLSAEVDQEVEHVHLPEPGALARYLRNFGESVCRMTLAVKSMEAARRYLDEHGVTYTYREVRRPVFWIHPDYACGASIVLHEYDPKFVKPYS